MCKNRWLVFSVVVVGLSACGDRAAQPAAEPAAPVEQAAPDAETVADAKPAAKKNDLAPCSAGADVPAGATTCLLDLGAGKDTYWADTDGVDPAIAGCHYEFAGETCEQNLPERTFGELCLDDDRLVESNPGKDECHPHGGDMGKPGVVSCSTWCAEQGHASGKCESGVAATGAHGDCTSARCSCDA